MRLIIFLVLSLLAVNLSADFLKAEAGAGIWYIKSTGEVRTKYDGNGLSTLELDNDLGLDSTISTYAWANFKHFIPVIPNARVEFTKFGTDATKVIPDWENKYFDGKKLKQANVNSKLNLDQIDAILYYNLLDDTFYITFDVGVGVKYYMGSIEVDNDKVNIDFPIPVIYGRAGVRIPMTNIRAETDLKYFKFTPSVDAEMFDFRLKVQATVLSLALLDLNVEAGYRVHRLQIMASQDSFSGFNADIKSEVSGFFGGINLSF